MKREIKAECSREKILCAAMDEFGCKSYDAASLNIICSANNISKGLVYHYFGNKDDLYLLCVKTCFEHLTAFLAEESYDFTDFQRGMNQYLARRFLFFQTYPQEGHLFFHTVLQPPLHLAGKIQELRAVFDAQSLAYYKTALAHVVLREGITEETALQYFVLFQEVFHGCFRRHMDSSAALENLMQAHEVQLSNLLNLMLYGLVKEGQQ